MQKGHYTLEVTNGIIDITPKAPIYYPIAESIANAIADSGTTKWNEICLTVINELDHHSKYIKSQIVGNMSYGCGFYPISQETVKGRKFEEAKAYVAGYTDAVTQFKEYFEENENTLISVLNKLLPNSQGVSDN